MSSKTLGQALDDYLADTWAVETVYIYQDKDTEPHVILTISDDSYDWVNVFSEDRNLTLDIEAKKKDIIALRAKIRGLEKEKKSVELSIKRLIKHGANL